MVDVSKAVQRVGKFLIQHKFFERDQRLTRAELMQQEPVGHFQKTFQVDSTAC